MPSFKKILEVALSHSPNLDRSRLERAYKYAEEQHRGEFHVSGDSYLDHALYVAETLVSFHPRENSLIAALLHSLPEKPDFDADDIRKLFGDDVAEMVSALGMLNRLKIVNQKADVDSIRKMVLAMAQDLRVVMVKLADRLQNLQRIEKLPVAMRKGLSREALEIYVPISSRMGIYTVKVQLEDLCFKQLYPKQYEVLRAQLAEYKAKRGSNIEEIKKELKSFLAEHGVEAVVEGRIKNLYSIYRKLKMKSHTVIDEIYDIFAMRVVLPTKMGKESKEHTDHLYAVLGLLHSQWRPLANRFKDYVAVPKPNGYQSLHTAVIGLSPLSSQATEIQIRSQKMHEEAEYGIASHWVYEDLKKVLGTVNRKSFEEVLKDPGHSVFGKYVGWIDALSKLQMDVNSGTEFMEGLKLDVFNDRIFVLTPGGEIKDLPAGATPVDFAYAVHTDVGHRVVLAKVNGAVVPLDYKLKSGEVVEVITSNKPHPRLHWLSFAKTTGARAKIKSYFKGLDKDRSFREGKEIINKYLTRMGKPHLDDEVSIFREYERGKLSLKERLQLVEEIGSGSVPVQVALRKVFGRSVPSSSVSNMIEKELMGGLILPKAAPEKKARGDCVYIAGESGVPYKFAQCCAPIKGQKIVAYVTRGHSVTVHVADCKVLSEADQDRIISADWNLARDARRYPVKVRLRMRERAGLIRDIVEAVAGLNVNIVDFGKKCLKGPDILRDLTVEVSDNEQYQGIVDKLSRVRNVFDVSKAD